MSYNLLDILRDAGMENPNLELELTIFEYVEGKIADRIYDAQEEWYLRHVKPFIDEGAAAPEYLVGVNSGHSLAVRAARGEL